MKKKIALSSTAAMGLGMLLPTVSVLAAPAVANGWSMDNGVWHYYQNGKKLIGSWAKDSQGWCYLSEADGSWVQNGWISDSQGWCYIQNGYWVQHSMWVKDSQGWCYIQDNGYWDGRSAVSVNPTEITSASIVSATFDSNTDNQKVAIAVNGSTINLADLNTAGYTVKFNAQDALSGGNDISASLFADTASGKLNTNLEYKLNETIDSSGISVYVQATLTKGTSIINTALQKITIRNTNPVSSAITDYTLYNDTLTADMNSTKLVTGETANFSNITVNNSGKLTKIYSYDNDYKVKSSNAGVVSVDSSNELTAVAPGKCTLTITYNDYTKTIPITVVDDERELSKVKAERTGTTTAITSIKTALYNPLHIDIEALDQYGDPFTGDVYAKTLYSDILTLNNSNYSITAGTPVSLDYNPVDTGSAVVYFYSDSDMHYMIPNSAFMINVVRNSDVAKSVFTLYNPTTSEINDGTFGSNTRSDYSTDNTIDVSKDRYVIFEFDQYNSDGLLLGTGNFDNSDITVLQSKFGVLNGDCINIIDGKIVAEAGKSGTATIKVRDNVTGTTYMQGITVTDKY